MIDCIIIYLDNPFNIGDKVVINGGAKCFIVKVGIRGTQIRYSQGQTALIPNAKIVNGEVQNFSRATELSVVLNIGIAGLSSEQMTSLVAKLREKSTSWKVSKSAITSLTLTDIGHLDYQVIEIEGVERKKELEKQLDEEQFKMKPGQSIRKFLNPKSLLKR